MVVSLVVSTVSPCSMINSSIDIILPWQVFNNCNIIGSWITLKVHNNKIKSNNFYLTRSVQIGLHDIFHAVKKLFLVTMPIITSFLIH